MIVLFVLKVCQKKEKKEQKLLSGKSESTITKTFEKGAGDNM